MFQGPQLDISSSLASASMLPILIELMLLAWDDILGTQHVLPLMTRRQAYQEQVEHLVWENQKSWEPKERSVSTGIKVDTEVGLTHRRRSNGYVLNKPPPVEARRPKPVAQRAAVIRVDRPLHEPEEAQPRNLVSAGPVPTRVLNQQSLLIGRTLMLDELFVH